MGGQERNSPQSAPSMTKSTISLISQPWRIITQWTQLMTKPKQKNYQIYVVAVNDDDHKTYPPYTYLSLVACIQWLFWSSATLRYAEDWEQIIMKSFSFLLNAVIPIGWMTIICWSELMKPCMQTSLSLFSLFVFQSIYSIPLISFSTPLSLLFEYSLSPFTHSPLFISPLCLSLSSPNVCPS